MSETTYQVFFTGRDCKREYLNQNFYEETKAQEAVEKLIDEGYTDVTYEGFTFFIEDVS